tara:strand:+ start:1134 stop:1418 length:285 start_codon:yes stop_codon:yes gene_type:complete
MAIGAILAAAQMGKMGYDMYNQRQTQEEQDRLREERMREQQLVNALATLRRQQPQQLGMPQGPTPGQLGRNQTSGLLNNLISAGQIYQNYKAGQ